MLLTLKVNNYLIYNSEMEFSMQANMHFKRFPNNVATIDGVNALKTAILIGPNNSGKTNFVRTIATLKEIMLGKGTLLNGNLFSNNPIVEISVSFLERGTENLFEIKYDTSQKEYIYERFARVERDQFKNVKNIDLLIRDSVNKQYYSEDVGLNVAMKVAAKNNIIAYLVDTVGFPCLEEIKKTIIAFATRIDIVDMNNIPIRKTIEMLKASNEDRQRIANFVLDADLYLDDFKYLSDDEIKIVLNEQNVGKAKPQENALNAMVPLAEMLHLASVYKGVTVPSMLFDSTGTKKWPHLPAMLSMHWKRGTFWLLMSWITACISG